MLSSVLESLFGHGTTKRPAMTGILLRAARVLAWKHRHRVARLEHVTSVLVDMADVQKALEAQGMNIADVQAVVAQLLADLPRSDADAPESEPTYDPRLDPLADSARVNGGHSAALFIASVAGALPPELGFVRRPLAACAPDLGATLDAALSSNREGGLTFEAWDPELTKCMGLMQHLADERWESWQLAPIHVLLALLAYKPYFAHFKGRGVDPVAVVRELGERQATPAWPVRGRPTGLVPAIGPALFALVLRAERYAAAEATNVRLRDLLLAIHDEPDLAGSIDQLVG